MNRYWMWQRPLLLILLLCLGLFLAACSEPQAMEVTRVVVETETITEVMAEEVAVEVTRVVEVAGNQIPPALATPAADRPADVPAPQRLIIKEGTLIIETADPEQAVSAATQHVIDVGGYIINQSLFTDDDGHQRASMRLAVPVDQFEASMRHLGNLGRVIREAASGQDVTDQFTDLNARLDNLIVTRDRLRTFLDEATTVADTLRINDELRQIEEEIAIIRGRMDSLRERAAFSTINLTIDPILPTPTPTPSPTPTPLPTPDSWQPGDTARTAGVQLQNTFQSLADFVIYYGITAGPWLLILFMVGLPLRRAYYHVRQEQPAAPAPRTIPPPRPPAETDTADSEADTRPDATTPDKGGDE
jgi:hypothetical protein